ncbi:hypothetical protein M0R45_001631 [Rubus argutus]|uniref:Uncharacterized protein n=1 Tax=Rubus argutus TaxID=59490 RepID=A0AAW1VKU3_RUBAR
MMEEVRRTREMRRSCWGSRRRLAEEEELVTCDGLGTGQSTWARADVTVTVQRRREQISCVGSWRWSLGRHGPGWLRRRHGAA